MKLYTLNREALLMNGLECNHNLNRKIIEYIGDMKFEIAYDTDRDVRYIRFENDQNGFKSLKDAISSASGYAPWFTEQEAQEALVPVEPEVTEARNFMIISRSFSRGNYETIKDEDGVQEFTLDKAKEFVKVLMESDEYNDEEYRIVHIEFRAAVETVRKVTFN